MFAISRVREIQRDRRIKQGIFAEQILPFPHHFHPFNSFFLPLILFFATASSSVLRTLPATFFRRKSKEMIPRPPEELRLVKGNPYKIKFPRSTPFQDSSSSLPELWHQIAVRFRHSLAFAPHTHCTSSGISG